MFGRYLLLTFDDGVSRIANRQDGLRMGGLVRVDCANQTR